MRKALLVPLAAIMLLAFGSSASVAAGSIYWSQWFLGPHPADLVNRENEELAGPVKTVRLEIAEYEQNRNGQWVEGRRRLYQTISFNSKGNRTEAVSYFTGTGAIYLKTLYAYDDKGRLARSSDWDPEQPEDERWKYRTYVWDERDRLIRIGMSSVEKDSDPVQEWECEYDSDGAVLQVASVFGAEPGLLACTYDSIGKLVEMAHLQDYGLSGHDVFLFDRTGRLVKRYRYDPLGLLVGKDQFTYHPDGGLAQVQSEPGFTDDGASWDKVVTILNPKGLVTEVRYLRDDEAITLRRLTYEYKFDTAGNWVSRMETETVQMGEEQASHPVATEYRAVTYYQ